jgi:hypothetical protein
MILLRDVHYNGREGTNLPYILAHNIIMSEEKTQEKQSFTKKWGSSTKKTKSLFKPEDFDIFCDKDSGMTYIFHGPELGCTIDFMEYNPENQRVTVFTKDGQKMDLGVRIQWLVRPYFAKPQDIYIIRTKDGQALDGFEVELRIKKEEEPQILN